MKLIKQTVADEVSKTSSQPGIHRIEHFLVLMLENHPFDHMLGRSTVPGVDGTLTGNNANHS